MKGGAVGNSSRWTSHSSRMTPEAAAVTLMQGRSARRSSLGARRRSQRRGGAGIRNEATRNDIQIVLVEAHVRTEESRVGREWISEWTFRGWQYKKQKNKN